MRYSTYIYMRFLTDKAKTQNKTWCWGMRRNESMFHLVNE